MLLEMLYMGEQNFIFEVYYPKYNINRNQRD